jgi:hypothetical protein
MFFERCSGRSLNNEENEERIMKATLLFRIAAVLLLLFATGHTIGFLSFTPPTPEGVAVRDAMSNVHFQVRNNTLSYGGFYRGFGLFVTAYLLFSAFLAWQLGSLAVKYPQAVRPLGWMLCTVQIVSLILSAIYFSGAPVISSALVSACLGWAAWRTRPVSAETPLLEAVESAA